jgi:hypothetical protein
MTRVLAAGCQPDFRPEHSTAKAFESLLRSFAATSTVERHMRGRERFIAAYPDLRVWFRAPLSERLGRFHRDAPGRTQRSVLHEARGYLCFLAYHGYARLDFEWLIAVPRLDVGSSFAGPSLEPEVVKLIDEASALGYERKNADAAIRRALTRILLHKGTTQITEVSDLDCDEYRQALASFSQRPDLRLLFGSAQRSRRDGKSIGITSTTCIPFSSIAAKPAKNRVSQCLSPTAAKCLNHEWGPSSSGTCPKER